MRFLNLMSFLFGQLFSILSIKIFYSHDISQFSQRGWFNERANIEDEVFLLLTWLKQNQKQKKRFFFSFFFPKFSHQFSAFIP